MCLESPSSMCPKKSVLVGESNCANVGDDPADIPRPPIISCNLPNVVPPSLRSIFPPPASRVMFPATSKAKSPELTSIS